MTKPARILPLLAFLLALLLAGPALAAPFQAAGCFVKLGEGEGGLLLIRDGWSKRWSLPGGRMGAGETPRQTAIRELLEETGVKAVAGDFLAGFRDFAVFSCRPDKSVQADRSPFASKGGSPAWRISPPATFANEVLEARVIDPRRLAVADWRFPEQIGRVILLYEQSPAMAAIIPQAVAERPAAVQVGLAVTRFFQSFENGWMDRLLRAADFLGGKDFFFLTLPFLWLLLPRRHAFAFSLVLLLSVIASGLAKDFFQTTRPFEWDAQLQRAAADGFGLPSGHAQLAAVFWGMMMVLVGRWWFSLAALVAVVLGGLTRVYLGVHFFYDVLSAWMISLPFVFLFRHWIRAGMPTVLRPEISGLPWRAGIVWFLLVLAGLVLRPHPELINSFAVWLGLLVGWSWQLDRLPEDAAVPGLGRRIGAAILAVLVLALLVLLFGLLVRLTGSALLVEGLRALKYTMAGAFLPLLPWLAWRGKVAA